MRSAAIERLGLDIQDHLDDILEMFVAGARITLIVRHPGLPDRDFVMTDDILDEVMAALERSKGRQPA